MRLHSSLTLATVSLRVLRLNRPPNGNHNLT